MLVSSLRIQVPDFNVAKLLKLIDTHNTYRSFHDVNSYNAPRYLATLQYSLLCKIHKIPSDNNLTKSLSLFNLKMFLGM